MKDKIVVDGFTYFKHGGYHENEYMVKQIVAYQKGVDRLLK